MVHHYDDFKMSRKPVDRVKSLRITGFNTSLSFLPPSTIHGRIDQVNQLLELDYQKRGGARYTALDKWTNQLNTLNQAIVSKLTWWCTNEETNWHVWIHLCMLIVLCANLMRRHTAHILRMSSHVQCFIILMTGKMQNLSLFFPCATNKCFNKSQDVYEKVYSISWICVPGGNKHL